MPPPTPCPPWVRVPFSIVFGAVFYHLPDRICCVFVLRIFELFPAAAHKYAQITLQIRMMWPLFMAIDHIRKVHYSRAQLFYLCTGRPIRYTSTPRQESAWTCKTGKPLNMWVRPSERLIRVRRAHSALLGIQEYYRKATQMCGCC